MKVLHIYKNYYPIPGGIENYIKMLAEYQVQSGCNVTVLVSSNSRKTHTENINGVRVIRAASITTISRTPLSFALLKWTGCLDADITHLHFPYPWGELAYLYTGKSPHMVITYHSDIVKQRFLLNVYRPFLFKILGKADRIIATSPTYIETSPFLQKMKSKCRVIPLGIDTNRFGNINKSLSRKIREMYNNVKIVLFVGRLRYFKGLDYLVYAMEGVDAKLLIIGTGPEENHLKKMVSGKRMEEKILFLGDISDEDLPAYYDACDVFVLPSSHRSEAFGTVLIEAMAAGKPVVSTELGTGTSFVNSNGKTGLVVPARAAKALSDAINLLLKDDDFAKSLAINAKKHAANFSKDIIAEKVLQLYKEVAYEDR
ncbi:MAG: glycosyltransferase [Candidatus Brocadia sp.]